MQLHWKGLIVCLKHDKRQGVAFLAYVQNDGVLEQVHFTRFCIIGAGEKVGGEGPPWASPFGAKATVHACAVPHCQAIHANGSQLVLTRVRVHIKQAYVECFRALNPGCRPDFAHK